MAFNQDIHHRKSIRLRGYDYSQPGAYFITICTHQRQPLFGDIVDGVMMLNAAGMMVEKCWREIPDHFPWVRLDEFIVMPNHLHGILVADDRTGTACRAPTGRARTDSRAPTSESFGKPVSGSIPTMIRSFKSALTRSINQINVTTGQPVWQRNYHEHIIRNEQAYLNITKYIRNNPQQWQDDVYCAANVQGGTKP